MRFVADHDLHIHSKLSPCSSDPRQTPEAILAYGVASDMRLLCLADHTWDKEVPSPGPCWGPLSDALAMRPLPQSRHCHFLFGCEVDMNRFDTLGISPKNMEELEFAVLSVSHLNLRGFALDPERTADDAQTRKERYKERLHHLLSMDLPFYKTGLSHFTVSLVCEKEPIRWITLFSDEELKDIFTKVRNCGMGVELNFTVSGYKPDDLKEILRPYFIAKDLGCKFYMAGDAHHPDDFRGSRANMERIIDLLSLEENDKMPFIPETIARLDAKK